MLRKRGFTLIELSLVVALMALLAGLVMVRYDLASPRQRAIHAARKLGRMIENCREKAIEEERLYAMRLDLAAGKYSVCAPAERTLSSVDAALPIFSGRLDDALAFKSAGYMGATQDSPVVVFFDANGVLAQIAFEVSGSGTTISIEPDPLVNEIQYDEK